MNSYHSEESMPIDTKWRDEYVLRVYKYSKPRSVTFPKSILSNGIQQIKEFHDTQQLYYFLTWTNKMQAIDHQFIEYTLKHHGIGQIAIFNAELQEKTSNETLYIVAILNENKNNDRNPFKWRMNAFMTAHQIYGAYNINIDDLPIGSRYKHNYFQSEINENHSKLLLNGNICISNWNKIPFIYSKQYKKRKPIFNDIELKQAIKSSIDNKLSLIPILKIDTRKEKICCESLIPIKLLNESKWIAVSYKIIMRNNQNKIGKTIITGLYIDPQDIQNKSSLIDPNAIYKYQWLYGEPNNIISDDSTKRIQILQQRLCEALNRETMWLSMLQEKEKQIQQIQQIQKMQQIQLPLLQQNYSNHTISTPPLTPSLTPPLTPPSLQSLQNINVSTTSLQSLQNNNVSFSYPFIMNNNTMNNIQIPSLMSPTNGMNGIITTSQQMVSTNYNNL